jgi:hypothetical protein
MANNTKDQPGRAQPNESENQPGSEPEDEQSRPGGQRQSQGTQNDPSRRQGGFDDQRKDEVSSPPAGGIDPERETGEEQTERKNADQSRPNPQTRKS